MKAKSCPFLGLEYDSSTYHAFASDGNSCHKSGSPILLKQQYQEQVCLSKNYATCPIYLELPSEIPYGDIYAVRPVRKGKYVLLFLVAIILIGVPLYLAFFSGLEPITVILAHPNEPTTLVVYTKTATALQEVVEPTRTATSPSLSFPLVIRQPTLTPTITRTPTPTETATPVPTNTARVNIRPTQVRQQSLPTKKPVKVTQTSVIQPTSPPYRPTVAP